MKGLTEKQRKENALDVDGQTFESTGKLASAEFTGKLTRPGADSEIFQATQIYIGGVDWYQVIGRIPEKTEWLIINVHSPSDGDLKIITFDEWQAGHEGVTMGGVMDGSMLNDSRGKITINRSGGGFTAENFEFTCRFGSGEYKFSHGKVTIKGN